MMNFQNLVIAPLNVTHERARFHCNVEALDQYIHKQAGRDIKRRISRIFVAVSPESPKEVIGYYSLSALSIELSELPEKLAGKLPKHPVPAALIGRLAISENAQGGGIGKMLLVDAIKRTLSVSVQIAIYAMVVDAINDNAKGFYEQFGFARLSDCSPRLFLPLKPFEDNSYGPVGLPNTIVPGVKGETGAMSLRRLRSGNRSAQTLKKPPQMF